MSDHRLSDSCLFHRCADDPYVEIDPDSGCAVIVHGDQRFTVKYPRHCYELAYMLCEAHDEIKYPAWAERVAAWKAGGRG